VLSHFESRLDRAIFAALTLLLAALTIATIASAATQVGRPWAGFVVWRNLVAPAIGGPDWPGIRAGVPQREVVTAIDGREVHDASELRAVLRTGTVGEPHRYVFRRGARDTEVAVAAAPLRWRDVLPVYLPYWLDGLAFFATGLIVFYFRPRLPAARATLALGTILGTVLLLASDVLSAFWLDRLYFACESLTPGALLHLALCFPEEKAIVRRLPWLRWAVYLPFVPLALLQIASLDGAPERHLAVNDLAYTAIAGAGLVSVASLVHAFLTSRSAIARQQAKIAMAGVALAAFLPSLGILAIVLLRADVPMNLLAPFFIVYPLSIGYAIARHDLFSVDRYLRTGVVYAALSLLVFASYAALVVGGESLVGAGRQLPTGVVPLYLLVVLAVFDPLRAAIQRGVDRLFYRQAYSYRTTVEATSRTLASVLDGERVAATMLDTLTDVMAIDWAVLVVLPEDADDAAPRLHARPATQARAAAACLDRRVAARLASGARDVALDGLAPTLVLPLRFEDDPVGILLLGEKKSGAHYTDDDLQLLDTLVHQAALALTNARAYEIIRRTQAELVEAERLAAVGELASTVAHGIRNPIAGIRAAAQVAREDVDGDAAIGETLDDIIAETGRLERRVQSILDLARPGSTEAMPDDLGAMLRRFVGSMQARVPRDAIVELQVAADLPRVRFDAVQLAEVLEILLVNALEATAGKGRIAVTAERTDDPERAIALSVADDGPGIDTSRLKRIFELFYTTKPTGTGVGLAMAKRLIERQAGTIAVASTPGHGATFTIRLPIAVTAPDGTTATSDAPSRA
jgi:signal transduction histidine kinase